MRQITVHSTADQIDMKTVFQYIAICFSHFQYSHSVRVRQNISKNDYSNHEAYLRKWKLCFFRHAKYFCRIDSFDIPPASKQTRIEMCTNFINSDKRIYKTVIFC